MTLTTELLIILSITVTLFFFTVGLRSLYTAVKCSIHWPPAVILGLGLMGLVHLAGVLTEFSLAGVWVAEFCFWLLVIAGVKDGTKDTFRWMLNARNHSLSEWLIPVAGAFYLVFWTLQFKDNVSLPSYHDGVAHLSWLIDVHRTGFAYLSKVPLSEPEAFGLTLNPFYPTGMQSLIATVSGLWMRMGVPATTVLKSWLACAHTAILLSILWGLRHHWKKIPLWVLLIAALTASTAFRFPIDASTEGGLSRIVAMAIVFPIAFFVSSDERFSFREISFLFGIGLFPAFLLHPSAFWMYALAVGSAAAAELKERSFRVSRGLFFLATAVAFGGLQIGALLLLNHSNTEPVLIPREYLGLSGLMDKFSDFFKIVLAGTYGPQKAVRILFHLGLLGMVYLIRTKLISMKVFLFHLGLLLFCLFAMATDVYRIPGSSLIGGAFYYYPARAACLLTLTIWLVSLSSFPLLIAGWQKAAGLWKGAARVKPAALKTIFVCWAAQFAIANAIHLPEVLHEFDTDFKTAKWSRVQNLSSFVQKMTPQNSILIAKPFELDVLGSVTHRRALFIYGDYVGDRDENSKAKIKWFESRIKMFDELQKSNGEFLDCRQYIQDKFRLPLSFILNENSWPALAQMTEADVHELAQKCRGLQVLGKRDGYWVFLLR